MNLKASSKTKHTFGYYISLLGTVLILLWVGVYKFTPTEAKAIVPLCAIFLMTISYLFSTPGIWKTVDGFPLTNFFILKDLMYLGFGVSLLESTQKQTI